MLICKKGRYIPRIKGLMLQANIPASAIPKLLNGELVEEAKGLVAIMDLVFTDRFQIVDQTNLVINAFKEKVGK